MSPLPSDDALTDLARDVTYAREAGAEEDLPEALDALRAAFASQPLTPRADALDNIAAAVVDLPCHHAADFGASPDTDPGPCLVDSEAVLAIIDAAR